MALRLKIILLPLSRLSPNLTKGLVSHSVAMFVCVTACLFVCPCPGHFWSNDLHWFVACDTYHFKILESWPPFTADDWGASRGRYVVVALGVSDRWHLAGDMGHVTFDTRQMTCDSGRMTHDIWFLLHFVLSKVKKKLHQKPESAKKKLEKSI